MGVEGKDKAKVLEAGALALSGQLGRTVLKLRKGSGLSLADLSGQSGVAKSIISQIERNETNPTLTTIWRLAHALDVSIESILHGGEDGPFIERVSRGETPILLSDDGLCRLAVIGWLNTVDWLQWYDFQAEPGGVLGSQPHPRGSIECLSVLEGELVVEVGEIVELARAGETLRYRGDRPHLHPQPRRGAGACDDGVHPQGRGEGLTSLASALANLRSPNSRRFCPRFGLPLPRRDIRPPPPLTIEKPWRRFRRAEARNRLALAAAAAANRCARNSCRLCLRFHPLWVVSGRGRRAVPSRALTARAIPRPLRSPPPDSNSLFPQNADSSPASPIRTGFVFAPDAPPV